MKRILILASIAFFFISCEKINSDIGVFIEGLIVDNVTSETIEGAKVELFTNNKTISAVTDENGYFSLGRLAIGDYTIIISKEGYANRFLQVNAAQELLIYDTGLDIVKSEIYGLMPVDDKVEFNLFRRVPGGVPVAAANFPYIINPGGINNIIEGTTDEKGIISEEQVPSSFLLIIDHEHNGIRYKYDSYVQLNYTNYIIINGYESDITLGIVRANILSEDGVQIDGFPVNQRIEIEFTQPVDKEMSEIDLYQSNWSSVDVSSTYDADDTRILIDPVNPLLPNTEYRVRLMLEARDNDQGFQIEIRFITEN